MQFQVPQFIEVEDKIFGQLTIKQFIYLAGGAGAVFLVFKFTPIYIAIFLCIPFAALALALAFYKPNEKQAFVVLLESAFMYFVKDKLYLWKKNEKKPVASQQAQDSESGLYVPKLGDSKLKDMTWSLDISESLNPVTKEEK